MMKDLFSGQVRIEVVTLKEWFNRKYASAEQSLVNMKNALSSLLEGHAKLTPITPPPPTLPLRPTLAQAYSKKNWNIETLMILS